MFQDQNKNIDDQDIEHLPVHTMLKDLEFINNPSAAIANEESEQALAKKSVPPVNLTAVQKSSPFLNPAPVAEKRSAPQETEPTHAWTNRMDRADIPVKTTVRTDQESPSQKSSKKPFILVFSVLIIIVIAAGGYYFWSTRQQNTQDVVIDNTPEEPTPEPVPEPIPEPEPAITFSTDKPNYLSIDSTQKNNTEIKGTLKNYTDKVSKSGATTPVEFIVTDTQNNPLLFSSFAGSLGLKLSPSVMTSLAETFSLFIYNDNAVTRLGLAIDLKNQPDLKSTNKPQSDLKNMLALEEKNLATELSPIFIPENYTLVPKTFASSTYNGQNIRYLNIISPEDLSVDYAIGHNKLLIGTTKMTIRAIIDKIATSPSDGVVLKNCGELNQDIQYLDTSVYSEQEKESLKCASIALSQCANATISFRDNKFDINRVTPKECAISIESTNKSTGTDGNLTTQKEKRSCILPDTFIQAWSKKVSENSKSNELFLMINMGITEGFKDPNTNQKINVTCN